ncbi:hypothetical protein DPMN_174191 [Dreissena polymorpha]|uniref:Uncharacterized protein n=1 Tax=Dreissena polymorpha TaxID=45954 RepID=A0A9D4E5Z4_DREPO|nr:hypothetical protein DPMN_174191 [Dreissena polymorpha]
MAHTKRRSITYLAAGGCENNPLLVLRVKLGHSLKHWQGPYRNSWNENLLEH